MHFPERAYRKYKVALKIKKQTGIRIWQRRKAFVFKKIKFKFHQTLTQNPPITQLKGHYIGRFHSRDGLSTV